MNSSSPFLLILMGLILAACSESATQAPTSEPALASGIMGGIVSEGNEIGMKSVVSLHQRYDSQLPFCTGTVIGDRHILTAGHCVAGSHPGLLLIRFAGAPQELFEVDSLKMHPDFERRLELKTIEELREHDTARDFALLKLKKRIPHGVEAAAIGKSSLAPGNAYSTQVFGYGLSKAGNKNVDGKLRVIQLQGYVDAQSNSFLKYKQNSKQGICSGDSGGPSFDVSSGKPVLVAVSSHTVGRKFLGYNYGYACHGTSAAAQVAMVAPWIEELLTVSKLRDQEGCLKDKDFLKQLLRKTNLDPSKPAYMGREVKSESSWSYVLQGTDQAGASLSMIVVANGSCEIIYPL